MTEQRPQLTIDGPVATLTLCRVDHHNRIDPGDIAVIVEHLRTVEETPGLAAMVLTGQGERTFCSGYTLASIGSHLDRDFEDMLDRVEKLRLPTICALNGGAYGGGTDLAMCCDFRIGVRGMRLFMPAARFGLHYYPGGLRRFVAQLGPAVSKKIFLTGLTLHDDELLRVGFLGELVERGDLQATVARYVDGIVQADPAAVASMKDHINRWGSGVVPDDEGRAAYEASLQAPATRERLAALAAKARTP